jgi:hypothetical protein
MVAESATGLALTAALFYKPLRSRLATGLFFLAIWLAVVAPEVGPLLKGFGVVTPPSIPTDLQIVCALATGSLVLSALLVRAAWIPAVVAAAGELALYRFVVVVTESDWELCALHLIWLGFLLGIWWLVAQKAAVPVRREEAPPPAPTESYRAHDLAMASFATIVGAGVALFFLRGGCDSADEWGYTYQAAVFAKLHAYGLAMPCFGALQNYWVFESDGRMFSQYTPGWPLFMAPFVALHAVTLAAPVSLGLFVSGVAPLARRAAAAAFPGRAAVARASGTIAALLTLGSPLVLINAGSRFPHVFVCGCFAWSLEALCRLTDRVRLPGREQRRWGIVLGLAAAWMLATRPSDGATLGVGIGLYFLYAVVRRRVGLQAFAAAGTAFVILGAFTLVLLRLQLGKWFVTGYSLGEQFHGWSKLQLGIPAYNQLRWGIPLATGSYFWWPLSPALGVAGLVVVLASRERRLVFGLVVGVLLLLGLYAMLEFGRGLDFGYGPRYAMPVIVPMAVGAGTLLAPIAVAARERFPVRSALASGGPWALVLAAAVVGVVRAVPLVYPYTREDVRLRSRIPEQIEAMRLHNTLVWISPGTGVSDPRDLTQNYPLDLYANDNLIVIDKDAEMRRCVTESFPGRTSYRTQGRPEITLVRE